jgi:Cysteine-rich CPCC
MLLPCPCCGYLVLDELPGSYDICPICGWEDDISQLRFPRMACGANKISLIEAQSNFVRHRDSDPLHPPLGRPPSAEDVRDPDWRPIDEAHDEIEEPVPGLDYGETYPADVTELYYRRSSCW